MAHSSGQTTPLLGSSPGQHDAEFAYHGTPSSAPGSLLHGVASETNVAGLARLKRSLKRKGGAFAAPRARRMTWLCIDSRGEKSFMHVDKRALISKVGLSIPIRDMRLLDHSLAISDSVILVRENAIIASLEHVRLIIMHDKVLIPREGVEQSDLAGHFVDALDEAVQEWFDQKAHFEEQLLRQTMYAPQGGGHGSTSALETPGSGYERYDETSSMSDVAQDAEPLPFELVVLEAALKEVIGAISIKVADIEQVTMPAMDALMKSVTPNNLERVRKVKTRLQRITGRCEAVRDELERFLQDDEDMDRMCLTRKKEIEEELIMIRRESVSIHSSSGTDLAGINNRGARNLAGVEDVGYVGYVGATAAGHVPERSQRGLPVPVAMGTSHRRGFLTRQSLTFNQRETTPGAPKSPGLLGGNGIGAAGQPPEEDVDADADAHLEVENMLESYFMQVDSMHDKLVALGSYIEDSEELLQFELDSSRNRLIRFEVILTVATFAIMPFNIVSGMLGENLKLPEEILGDTARFVYVNIMSGIVSCSVFAAILWYMRRLKI